LQKSVQRYCFISNYANLKTFLRASICTIQKKVVILHANILFIMMEIIRYCIPALCVLLATWLVMHKFYKGEAEKRLWELKLASQKEISPLRMRAYERLALLLERTTPKHILLELSLDEMSILQVQQHLMRTIRMEYDHNLSQQIYVSEEVWSAIIASKDQMLAFINSIAQQMPPESTALDYAKVLITAYSSNGQTTNDQAMQLLRAEARSLL
jgi:hypothetical protein